MLTELVRLVDDMTPVNGANPTYMDEVTLYRADSSIARMPLIYDQCMCLAVQGGKTVSFSDKSLTYDPAHFLVVPTIVPLEGVTEVTPGEPLLVMTFSIDFIVLQGVVDRIGRDFFESSASMAPSPGAYVENLTHEVMEPVVRLLKSLRTRGDASILGSQILREVYYRVLMCEHGHVLASAAHGESGAARIAKALRLMQDNYAHALDVAELASHVNMSSRTFHQHFKTVTSYTPIQYLKRIRLEKARQIIVHQGMQIAVAAHMVGYESGSQFSREFKRHFGYPPSEASANDGIHVLK